MQKSHSHNPSEFCLLFLPQDLERCRHAGGDPSLEPSTLKVVILCCTWFPCPVSDLLDTRCMLSFEKSLPPRMFACLCVRSVKRRNMILLIRSEHFFFPCFLETEIPHNIT